MRMFRQTATKDGKTIVIKKWYCDIRLNHQRFRLPLYESKKLSSEFTANLEVLLAQYPGGYDKKVQQWIDGLPQDMAQKLAKIGLVDKGRLAGGLPIQDHIDNYIETLKHRQNTEAYCEKCKARIQAIADGCGFLTLADMQPGKILKFVSDELAAEHLSQGTYNHYLRAVKGFCRWLYIENRLPDISKNISLITVTDFKKRRRPLTLDEIATLLNWLVTRAKKTRSMTGIERKALYVLAMTTGLRADEIRSLTVGAVDFDNQKICLKAAHTKNSKDAALPLRPDVLDDLRLLTQGKLPGAPLFRHITDKTAAMLRKDMLDARADYLIEKYPDEKERIKAAKNDCFLVPDTDAGEIDFHSLRHTFGTLLAQSGVHPKTAQTLMRHSSIDLTMNIYTHSTRSAETAAINQLPGFEQKKQHKQQG